MDDDATTTPPVEVPALTPEEQRKADNRARSIANLRPQVPGGASRNPFGKNGRTQHAELVRWLEGKSTPGEVSRIERVWQATYLEALKGSDSACRILIEQHAGKPRQQIDLSSEDGSMTPARADAIASVAIAMISGNEEQAQARAAAFNATVQDVGTESE